VHVGIVGGTGPAGRGLAVRLAAAGHEVTVGSRDAERAGSATAELIAANPDRRLSLHGADNAGAAQAELVVLATPWDSMVATVQALREELAGKVVVSMGVAMMKFGREVLPLSVPRGSVAAMVQAALPASLVSGSFHHLAGAAMEDLDSGLQADVLVCSDHRAASEATMALVNSIDGLRGLDVGSLARAGTVEAFTGICVALNIRYKTETSVQFRGIPS
jgi:8-hydroxy-5-deazaflavin:NADPH oxidoreductase